jgi:hypothetical protein
MSPAKKDETVETTADLAQGGPPAVDVPEYPRRVMSTPSTVTLEFDSEEEAVRASSAGRPVGAPEQWQNGWRVTLEV